MKKQIPIILLLVVCLFWTMACDHEDNPSDGLKQVVDDDGHEWIDDDDSAAGATPEFLEIYIEENPDNLLSYWINLTTDLKTRASVNIRGEDGSDLIFDDPAFSKDHRIPVLGLVSDTDYSLQASAVSANGIAAKSGLISIHTGPLPSDFPPIEITVLDKYRMQSGITIFNIYRYTPERDHHFGLLIGIDEQGRVVWYHRDTLMTMNTSLTLEGNLLYNRLVLGTDEIDWMGQNINRWNMAEIRIWFIHHEIMELPWGNLMGLSSEKQRVSGYEVPGYADYTLDLIGDVVVEFDREGNKVGRWSMFDYLDPHRIRAGFFDQTFWRKPYFWVDHPMDWTHANAVLCDEKDNSFIVSLRHQDWLIKIDMDTDELVWKFGEDGDFTLTGAGQWQYHQHAPRFMENGNIILYDNGNNRPDEKGEDPYTRVVEYRLDEDAMTAEQVWEYRGDQAYYAPYLGDVLPLENGNILICDGGLTSDPFQHVDEPDNHKRARLAEVTYEENPEKVWEMVIDDPEIGYSIYSVMRVSWETLGLRSQD